MLLSLLVIILARLGDVREQAFRDLLQHDGDA